jgi:hypothetical protein
VGVGLSGNQLLPGLSALTDNIHGVLAVLALSRESELVLRLSVRDLVDTEPLIGGTKKSGKVTLNILNVVELGSKRVLLVNNDNLPVGLLLVQKCHDSKNLYTLDLSGVGNELSNLANVQWVVVSLGLGLGVDGVGVLPGL